MISSGIKISFQEGLTLWKNTLHYKKDPVLIISGLLAVISAFFIPPDAAYLSYIDFRVLALLYCLMCHERFSGNRAVSKAGCFYPFPDKKYKAADSRPCIPVFFPEYVHH